MMTEEEEKNAKKKQQSGRRRLRACMRKSRQKGERHLDQAAEWIVRRVVEF